MGLTFKQGTRLIIVQGTTKFVFSVEDASASQTYIESSRSVKTLHNPNSVPKTFSTEKSPVSLSFKVFLGDTNVDPVILEWFGLTEAAGKYIIPTTLPLGSVVPRRHIYIDAGNTVYKVSNCVAQNMTISLDRKAPLSASITCSGEDLTVATPTETGIVVQNSSAFFNAPVVVSGATNLVAVTFDLLKETAFIRNQSTHNIGSIYIPNTPILNNINVSGSITTNKSDDILEYSETSSVNIKYGSSFEINIDACNTTDRWDMGSIHKTITEYKMLPEAMNSYIKL